jgi:hypothetical protein
MEFTDTVLWPLFVFCGGIAGLILLVGVLSRVAGYGLTRGYERARRAERRRENVYDLDAYRAGHPTTEEQDKLRSRKR